MKKTEKVTVLVMAAVIVVVAVVVSYNTGKRTGEETATIKWQSEIKVAQERTAEAVSEMYLNIPQLRGKLVGKVIRTEIPYNGEVREYSVEFGHDKMWPSWTVMQK